MANNENNLHEIKTKVVEIKLSKINFLLSVNEFQMDSKHFTLILHDTLTFVLMEEYNMGVNNNII